MVVLSSSSELHFAQSREVFAADGHGESGENGGPVEVEGIEDPTDLRPDVDDLVCVDAFTGAALSSIPLHLSEGRGGFGPDLRLEYNSRNPNGVFGVGWHIDIPSIGRRVAVQAPLYDDQEDTFEIGNDELIPGLRVSGGYIEDRFDVGEYSVLRYRRRHEQSFDRIERWLHQPSGQIHWRTVDTNNVTSLYGINPNSRISDPTDSTRIARWLLNERFDDRGNVVRFVYKAENFDGVDLDSPFEAHRKSSSDQVGGGRYLKRVLYANAAPHDRGPWHFEVVFDYGDHAEENPTPVESQPWSARPDPYSDNRYGFEIRNWRRCQRVLMFHRFAELDTHPYLVSATEFAYDDSRARSTLTKATHTGFTWRDRTDVEQRSLPTLSFEYTGAVELAAFELDSSEIAEAFVDPAARWIDFYTEGLPGFLTRSGDDWNYIRNLGDARFAKPEAVPFDDPQPVVDITDATVAHERSYQPLLTSKVGSKDDQHVGYLDLNGDYSDDVVVASDEVIRWYPSQGEEGFGDPVIVHIGDAERVRPQRLSQDNTQSFHVADLNGDGLVDLIRVRDGEVSYWPGLGRGRFGDRVVMGNSPSLDDGARSVVFADLTGDGSADLVRLANGEVEYWRNIGGRQFTPNQTVAAPGATDGGKVAAVDLFGRGFDSVVWLDDSSDTATVRYLAPVADQTADLLSSVDNGRGGVARVAYASSTDLWRRDRDSGIEWLFTSPVPVNVVERIEIRDSLASTRLMRRYVFRHAAYEPGNHSFTGFAASEVWQGGLREDYALPGLFKDDDVLDVAEHRRAPFLVTKRWFHTGTMVDGGDLTEELVSEFHTDEVTGRHRWLSGHQMPLGQKARDVTDSHRVLRGLLLREEIVSGLGGVPLKVCEATAWVRQVQPARGDKLPSFNAIRNEFIEVEYDAKGTDPRIRHELTLLADDLGQITRSATIAYGRREPEVDAQAVDHITVTDLVIASSIEQATWYRVGVPMQTTLWSLPATPRPVNQLFDSRDIRTAFDSGDMRLISKTRHRYWSNDCTQIIPAGKLVSRALSARDERLVFDEACTNELVSDEPIDDLLRFEGGYEQDSDGWWSPGITQTYDASRFYVVNATRGPLGHETKLRYDSAVLFVVESEDAFGNVTRIDTHPRTLEWWRKTDVNGNVIVRRFDPVGNVLSVATTGKAGGTDGDSMAADTIEASSGDDPTAVVTYRLDSWSRDKKPAWVRVRHRDRHQKPSVRMRERVCIYDAFGREIGRASRAGDDRWLVSNLVERDALGQVVRQGVPFFSDEVLGDEIEREASLRRGRLIVRNAFGKIVRADHPDGTITLSNPSPWASTFHDAVDNILDSEWYSIRQGSSQSRAGDFGSRRTSRHVFERRAAVQAAMHAQTPMTTLFDASGNVVAIRKSLTRTEQVEQRFERDARGNVTSVFDSEGRRVVGISYDLVSRPVRVEHLDSGAQAFVRAASDQILRRHNAVGSTTRYRYDANGALTHVYVSDTNGDERLVERTIWGGGETNVPDAEQHNLVLQPHMRLTSGGLEVLESCDLHGNATRRVLYPATAQTAEPDWSAVSDLAHAGQVLATLTVSEAPLSFDDPQIIETRYDALSRPVRSTGPDGVAIHYQYGAQGRVALIAARPSGVEQAVPVARNIRFDPAGHLASALLGTDVRIKHRRDGAGRLAEIAVLGRNRESTVQDHQLVYDAAGNVISVTDRGELVASYTYDGLDRLVKAEGVEPSGEGSELRRYTNSYTLDQHGNITQVLHTAPKADWQREYNYESGSNKLRAASHPNGAENQMASSYDYDAAGNLIKGPNGETFGWSHEGRLISASVNGTSVVYAYDSAGELRRRLSMHEDDLIEDSLFWNGFERVRRIRQGEVLLDRTSTTVRIGNRRVSVLERHENGELQLRVQVSDHIDSVIAELDGDGSGISEEEFMPFGVPWYRKGRDEVDLSTKRFSFRGGRFDTELALLFIGSRPYSPWNGRYLSPAGAPAGTLNAYVIENANPQRY